MPCFSANNPRFVGVAQHQHQFSNKERARTSIGSRIASDTNLYSAPKRQCDEVSHVKGYGPMEFNKQHRGANRGRPRQPHVPTTQALLPQKEFERLRTAAKVVSVEERLDALMKQEEENKRLVEEAEKTRERFKKIDDARKRAAETNVDKEDLFGAGEKLKVLERSFLAKTEQEEEVKHVNAIIINAKCHAIREAQIQEKTELDRRQREDEILLERHVIESAVKALNEEDEKFEKQKENKIKYAADIKKQLNDREHLRFMESRRIEEEAKMLKRAGDALKRDEDRRAKLERERRAKFREELAKIAEMSTLFKKMLCEQEREMELRVAAYMREKEERERALQAEKKLAKEELERKQSRIFLLAQKMLESKTNREETAYLREQEKIEREYRHKEKEAALRKRQLENQILEARLKQKDESKHRQALQIARAEHEFNTLMEQLKQDETKQKKLDDEVALRRTCYRSDIVRQMSDKELERRRLLEMERNRAMALRESERQRDANIRAVINAKVAAMRDACLPEKYVRDVEKQLQKIAMAKKGTKQ